MTGNPEATPQAEVRLYQLTLTEAELGILAGMVLLSFSRNIISQMEARILIAGSGESQKSLVIKTKTLIESSPDMEGVDVT